MEKKTFDLIAKCIAQKHNVQIMFEDCKKPYCIVDKREIYIPSRVDPKHLVSILTFIMHEAGHLRWSIETSNEMMPKLKDEHEKTILNVMEDARIDNLNLDFLPNMVAFYRQMFQEQFDRRPKEEDIPVEDRVLANLYLYALGNCFTGFKYTAKDVYDKEQQLKLWNSFFDGVSFLRGGKWNDAYQRIVEIKNKLFPPLPEQKKQEEQEEKENKSEQSKEQPEETEETNEASEDTEQTGQSDDPEEDNEVSEETTEDTKPETSQDHTEQSKRVEELTRPGNMWDAGAFNPTPDKSTTITPYAFEEQTVKMFKEMLNITEVKRIDNGVTLSIDNLTDFFTEQIETLFRDDTEEKLVKSKIAFVLDRSGSMETPLLDETRRDEALLKSTQAIINVIKEVQETEGINVDYDVYAFDDNCILCDKDNWVRDYKSTFGGGTRMFNAIKFVLDTMQTDFTIDGKRILAIITDGEVYDGEIDKAKQLIMQHANDIRVMFIPIGNPIGPLVETITNGRCIVQSNQANEVILSTVMDML